MANKHKLRLGDAVARIARALHIPHCEKCEERRLILNEIRTLGLRETIRRLKAVGDSGSGLADESWSLEETISRMEDCCGEKNKKIK